jgi:hypothetical protein
MPITGRSPRGDAPGWGPRGSRGPRRTRPVRPPPGTRPRPIPIPSRPPRNDSTPRHRHRSPCPHLRRGASGTTTPRCQAAPVPGRKRERPAVGWCRGGSSPNPRLSRALRGKGPTMSEVSLEAGHRPAGAARHRGGRPPGSARRPAAGTVRTQLHLGEQTAKRLAVHAALVGRNASRVADEILAGWLARFGKGREIFTNPVGGEVSGVAE